MTVPVFDTASMLAAIRGWVEIERPTKVPSAVNRMVDQVERSSRRKGVHHPHGLCGERLRRSPRRESQERSKKE